MQPLTIELVPKTCWFSNIRNHVPKAEWDRLRKSVFQKAGNRCEICGGRGPKWPVECHEIFEYDDERRIQTLARVVSLCPACHRVKHFGMAQVQGLGEQALRHLCKVNGWDRDRGTDYVSAAFKVWERRSRVPWDLDLSLLKDQFGIVIKEELSADRARRGEHFYRRKMAAAGE